MSEAIFWGAVLRVAQAFVQAAPTILVGLFVAGIFRRLLGHEGTRRLFGCRDLARAAAGVAHRDALPVCSLGVIPIAREMRRARISGGAILAFAMTAPLFNPLSMLYGLTLSAPFVILSFAFCTMVVVTAVGAIWNRIFPGTAHEEPAPAAGRLRGEADGRDPGRRGAGGRRAVAGLHPHRPARAWPCSAAVLPPGSLQTTMEHKNPYAPLAMAGVAIPAYATPLVAMSQLGSMFQHANSVGAAFVLLTLGAGINLGLIAWVFRNYGLARGLTWLAILLAVVLPLAYAIENPLYPSEIEPPGHTHAFDIYCRPFEHGSSDLPRMVLAKLKEDLHPFERVGLTVLALLAATGLALQVARPPLARRGLAGTAPEPAARRRLAVRRRGPGPGAGRDRPGRARRPQRRGVLRLLPGPAGGLQGDDHPPGRGADRGDERQPGARRRTSSPSGTTGRGGSRWASSSARGRSAPTGG